MTPVNVAATVVIWCLTVIALCTVAAWVATGERKVAAGTRNRRATVVPRTPPPGDHHPSDDAWYGLFDGWVDTPGMPGPTGMWPR